FQEYDQYVARPPVRSNVAAVENEHSSVESQATIDATSSGRPARPIGIFAITIFCCSAGIPENISDSIAAGVTQLTRISVLSSSLPSDLVKAMTPSFDAE